MYAISFTNCRFVKTFPKYQIFSVSKFNYRGLANDSTRISTTTLIQKTLDEDKIKQRRYFSLQNIKNSGPKQFNLDFQNILAQSKGILQTVKLSDLTAAPQPAFWYALGGLVPFVLPTVSILIFGYSPFLASLQLFYGATVCSFVGGIKWGHATTDQSKQSPTWENLGHAILPQMVAWTGLMLPQTLGFLLVSGGLLTSAYIDLTSSYYPPWANALRLLSVPAVAFLLLTGIFSLFH